MNSTSRLRVLLVGLAIGVAVTAAAQAGKDKTLGLIFPSQAAAVQEMLIDGREHYAFPVLLKPSGGDWVGSILAVERSIWAEMSRRNEELLRELEEDGP